MQTNDKMIQLKENRVWRPFIGGKLLDELSEKQTAMDGHYPERWICSTTKASDGTGISKTIKDIAITEYTNGELPVLVKLLDSASRLMLQVHPTDADAQKYFGSAIGKTEAWHVLKTREIDGIKPYVYLGFKEGVTKKLWQELFEKQDVRGMENCLHRINVKPGDTFFIPGGVPHAMGSGVLFAEIQQPIDLTLRTEWISPAGEKMPEESLHGGAGWEALFSCFHYDGCSLEETLRRYMVPAKGDVIIEKKLFTMKKRYFEEDGILPVENWGIAVILDGPDQGKEYYLKEDGYFKKGQKVLYCTKE